MVRRRSVWPAYDSRVRPRVGYWTWGQVIEGRYLGKLKAKT